MPIFFWLYIYSLALKRRVYHAPLPYFAFVTPYILVLAVTSLSFSLIFRVPLLRTIFPTFHYLFSYLYLCVLTHVFPLTSDPCLDSPSIPRPIVLETALKIRSLLVLSLVVFIILFDCANHVPRDFDYAADCGCCADERSPISLPLSQWATTTWAKHRAKLNCHHPHKWQGH